MPRTRSALVLHLQLTLLVILGCVSGLPAERALAQERLFDPARAFCSGTWQITLTASVTRETAVPCGYPPFHHNAQRQCRGPLSERVGEIRRWNRVKDLREAELRAVLSAEWNPLSRRLLRRVSLFRVRL